MIENGQPFYLAQKSYWDLFKLSISEKFNSHFYALLSQSFKKTLLKLSQKLIIFLPFCFLKLTRETFFSKRGNFDKVLFKIKTGQGFPILFSHF